MDNELIKMSDCPEIRDRWEPKVGDEVWYGNREYLIAVKYSQAQLHLISSNRINGTHDELVKPNDCIYRPRIEDVLEWLGDKPVAMETEGKDNDCLWDCYIPYGENGHTARQLIHALLRVYMQLEHGKTWDGEKWI